MIQRVGTIAYKLELPAESKIHPIFHVSQLKKVKGPILVTAELPKELNGDLEMDVTPEALLGIRYSDSSEKLTCNRRHLGIF